MLGYMVTWTTYGTWLQGDERGYVKDGEVLGENGPLKQSNKSRLVREAVIFNKHEKRIAQEAIELEAKKNQQKVLAAVVCRDHVHIVLEHDGMRIEQAVSQYKAAIGTALRKEGFKGRLWTNGFDKRFCFDLKELNHRIRYVQRHNE